MPFSQEEKKIVGEIMSMSDMERKKFCAGRPLQEAIRTTLMEWKEGSEEDEFGKKEGKSIREMAREADERDQAEEK